MPLINRIIAKLPPPLLHKIFRSPIGGRLVKLYDKANRDNGQAQSYTTKYQVIMNLSPALPGERAIIYNAYEPKITDLFLSLIEKGSVVFDIGSWVGYYALLAARIGAKEVIAIEIDIENIKKIKQNIASNEGFDQIITVIRAAIGNKKGASARVERRDNSHIMSHVVETDEGELKFETLDNLASNKKIVDLVMMDIEGYEFNAILGASHLLREKRIRKLLIEVHPEFLKQRGQSDYMIISYLKNCGYEVEKIKGESSSVYHLLALA